MTSPIHGPLPRAGLPGVERPLVGLARLLVAEIFIGFPTPGGETRGDAPKRHYIETEWYGIAMSER
jgi:hypothetical protein